MSDFSAAPGGLGYRTELHDHIVANHERIPWLELISEQFLDADPERLAEVEALSESFAVVLHGVELSIASADREPDAEYLRRLGDLAGLCNAAWVSDHCCFTRSRDIELGTLTPIRRTRKLADLVARRCDNIAKAVGRPFLLENITYYLDPGGDLSEPEFFRYILDHSDALVLLDLTNLYTNSVNLGVNPSDYLEALPVDRVGQVHLAGGRWYGDTLIDSHEAEVPDPVWALLDQWRNAGLEAPCIIERDQAFPDDFEELLSDVARAAEMQSV